MKTIINNRDENTVDKISDDLRYEIINCMMRNSVVSKTALKRAKVSKTELDVLIKVHLAYEIKTGKRTIYAFKEKCFQLCKELSNLNLEKHGRR